MWGAFVLLFLFLLINPEASGILQSLAGQAWERLFQRDPSLDLVLAVILAAGIGATILMVLWPRREAPRRYHIVYRHSGTACAAADTSTTSWLPRIVREFCTTFLEWWGSGSSIT
ncbi:MAG: hypothetical protein C5B51_00985 [Terriglobia bacterium]|nr:MAG: hypothetical protein C5B51_00985 [Terriglobia bacterium]